MVSFINLMFLIMLIIQINSVCFQTKDAEIIRIGEQHDNIFQVIQSLHIIRKSVKNCI